MHSFTESDIGVWLLSFFGLIVAVTLGLIGWRATDSGRPAASDSPLSREGAFLANNVLFAGFAFVVLLGTVFPLIVEAVNGDQLSVGAPYFERMTVPIGITLLFLMAVAPVLPWRKASGDCWRSGCSGRRGWGRRPWSRPCCSAPTASRPCWPSGWAGLPRGRPCGRWCWPRRQG